jgi:DNA processing protein
MDAELAIALTFAPDLPRHTLLDRIRAGDPAIRERADTLCAHSRAVRQSVAAADIDAIPWSDSRFPISLLALADCPPALWVRGVLTCLDAPLVAIVGSRAASAVALETATRLGADLAARGVTVVSGLARGVDSAAHRGAVKNGRTVAVLGSGVDRIYPREHRALADEIAREGLIVSEHPPGAPPLAFHFPLRNRLISGMCRAVVVVEASERSGSLITAACALEQGRDVMAVPGNVLTGRNRGGHALLRDGAKIVECADDVITELGLEPAPGAQQAEQVTRMSAGFSGNRVLRRMDLGHAYDLDALADATGLDVPRLLPTLVELELSGSIRRLDGGRFMRSA